MGPMKVVAVSCSPSVGGKTRAVLEAVLAGAAALGAETALVEMGEHDGVQPVVDANESHRRVFKFVLESTGGKTQTLKIDYNEATNDQSDSDQMGVQPMTLPMTATTVPAAICPKIG